MGARPIKRARRSRLADPQLDELMFKESVWVDSRRPGFAVQSNGRLT